MLAIIGSSVATSSSLDGNVKRTPRRRCSSAVHSQAPRIPWGKRLSNPCLDVWNAAAEAAAGNGEAVSADRQRRSRRALAERADGNVAAAEGGGLWNSATGTLIINDNAGNVLCETATATPCQTTEGAGEQVVSPVDAFLLSDILSDNMPSA